MVASGLTNPRAFTWAADGTFYVAQAGTGGTNPATEEAPISQAIGPFGGGPTASVVRIEAGCPVPVAGGLPSTVDATGAVLGAEDVAILGGQLYVAVDGGGPVHGNPDQPSGIYRIDAGGTATLVADLSAWTRANPLAFLNPDFDPDAAGFSLVADEGAGKLWSVNPNGGEVFTVTQDGTVTRVADLSVGHPVPTGLALAPQGGVYVGFLTAIPLPQGAARVVHVAPDGTVTDAWTGLSAVTDVAVGPDGTLYATELGQGIEQPPFLVPGTGRVVRQTGPGSAEPVATGLMFPISLAFGPDGGLYVSLPALGANNGEGVIARIDVAAAPVSATPEALLATPVAGPHAAASPVPCAPGAVGTPTG